MIEADQARHRMQEADPVPTLHAVSDELVDSVRTLIDAEIAGQSESVLPAPGRRDRGRQRRRPVIAVAAAFAITVAIIGAVGLLRTDEARVGDVTTTLSPTTITTAAPETTLPSTTVAAVPPPTPSTTVATTIPPKPASLEISWQRVPEQASLEDGWIAAVAQGESSYVAVGGTVGCGAASTSYVDSERGPSQECAQDAAVWVSPDGVTWERIESDSFAGAVVRESSYSGTSDGLQYMNDIAAGPQGLVAVGAAPIVDLDRPVGYLDRPGIWVSSDGREWDRLPHDDDLFGGVEELSRVAAFGDLVVAVGGSYAWVSSDGVNWERVNVDQDLLGVVLDLTVWDGKLVAVGERDGHPAVWTSDDGSNWTMVEDTDLITASGRLQGVGGDAAGLVAMGTTSGWVTAWHSADGTDWQAALEGVGNDTEWDYQARTAVSVGRGTAGIEDDLILINGMATLWGTADGGDLWYSAGEFEGGQLEVLAGPSFAVFNTINQVVVADDQLLAFGKVVAWSGTESIGGLCYIDPGDGSKGSCRSDAAIWIGTWDGAP